jgi:hypothetical protein
LYLAFGTRRTNKDNKKKYNIITMKLEVFIFFTIVAVESIVFGPRVVSAIDCSSKPLPDIQTLIDTAFPPWNIDANENRVAGGGKWNPIYLTKKFNGLEASKGKETMKDCL